jgi:hypothetical protein
LSRRCENTVLVEQAHFSSLSLLLIDWCPRTPHSCIAILAQAFETSKDCLRSRLPFGPFASCEMLAAFFVGVLAGAAAAWTVSYEWWRIRLVWDEVWYACNWRQGQRVVATHVGNLTRSLSHVGGDTHDESQTMRISIAECDSSCVSPPTCDRLSVEFPIACPRRQHRGEGRRDREHGAADRGPSRSLE